MRQWVRDRYRRRDLTKRFRRRQDRGNTRPISRGFTSPVLLDSWKRGGNATAVQIRSSERLHEEDLLPILDLFVCEELDDDPPLSFYDLIEDDPMEQQPFYEDPDDLAYDPYFWD
jgi:hypothetical protein